MTPGVRPALPPGPYLVVGLARSGAAAARMLVDHGEVMGVDSGSPDDLRDLDGVEVTLGSDGLELVDRAATVVKSPGVPHDAPAIAAAHARGIPVVGELDLAWRLLGKSEFIAVTGTNGKTTTAELLGEIHRRAGIEVMVAGNVGTPLTNLVEDGSDPAVVVAECSSFQLEDAPAFAPECALILNLAEDHLDRHGTFEAYRAAKLSMFGRLAEGDVAVAPASVADAIDTRARLVRFGEGADVDVIGRSMRWRGEDLMEIDELGIPGDHNLMNAMGAVGATLSRGVDRDAVVEGLRRFRGVQHRLELVAERGGVRFVNDSKATNVASAAVGIEAFEGVHAILGGSLKGGDFEALREPVEGHCRAVYLIGEAADALERDLAGAVPIERCGRLEVALARAVDASLPGDVVLLSPACASFDQFRDYEERGATFKELVGELSR